MKVFRFTVSGIVVVYDTEYASYDHSKFKEFIDYGYSGNISIAMSKINNQILGNGDFYLDSIHVDETTKEEFTNRYKGKLKGK